MTMLTIDGAYGEGGGQMLRTSLTLAALTGQPVRIINIRAKRPKPGLAPQHLATVLALGRICRATVTGATFRSTELTFQPNGPPLAGKYCFDIPKLSGRSSAGSCSLLLQGVMLPLAFGHGTSRIELIGGTNVAWSPPYEFIEQVYLPFLSQLGLNASSSIQNRGFYPKGGGKITVQLSTTVTPLNPLTIIEPGSLQAIKIIGVTAGLPDHVAQRMTGRAEQLLAELPGRRQRIEEIKTGPGNGAALFICGEYEKINAGFSAIGVRGKPAEQVAEEACRELLTHHQSGTALDPHLADQLLLPAALAQGKSEFTTSRLTRHLFTNAQIIKQMLNVPITIQGELDEPGRVQVHGIGFSTGPRPSET